MADKRSQSRGVLVILCLGVLGGLALSYWGVPNRDFLRQQEQYRNERLGISGDDSPELTEGTRLVEQYVSAIQQGACSDVIGMTWWMQERLQLYTESGGDVASLELSLCDDIRGRTPQGNRLRSEGIEDWYVFTPSAEVKVVSADRGDGDLAKPVSERVWLRVEYVVPAQALVDESGNPIKSLKVGVSVSADKYILKAGVMGNVEIDFDSISYRW